MYIHIMRRIEVYLDDDLWNALHLQASIQGASVSELVRQALRKEYMNFEERRRAMLAIIDIRKDRDDISDSTEYVRKLRRDRRISRLRSSSS